MTAELAQGGGMGGGMGGGNMQEASLPACRQRRPLLMKHSPLTVTTRMPDPTQIATRAEVILEVFEVQHLVSCIRTAAMNRLASSAWPDDEEDARHARNSEQPFTPFPIAVLKILLFGVGPKTGPAWQAFLSARMRSRSGWAWERRRRAPRRSPRSAAR